MHDAPQPDHWIERRARRRVPHGLICNSRWTDERAGAWLPHLPRWIIHPPVAAPAADTLARARVRSQLGAASQSVIILSASRMERWKGHARLVRAAARLHGDTRVWIAGGPQRPPERGYLRELRRIVHEAGLDARVSLLGERDDVASLMQAADIVCQPNVTPEPFGITFVEALYAARPVVTTALGGAVEIVSPECGILLPPDDDAALAAALQHLVDDESLRRSLGASGPSRARALCDPAAQAARLAANVRSLHTQPAEARC
jgi:glycosyltransferase involved in cell wall biosynthesis